MDNIISKVNVSLFSSPPLLYLPISVQLLIFFLSRHDLRGDPIRWNGMMERHGGMAEYPKTWNDRNYILKRGIDNSSDKNKETNKRKIQAANFLRQQFLRLKMSLRVVNFGILVLLAFSHKYKFYS